MFNGEKIVGSLKQMFGLDRAILYTVLSRVIYILGSTGTVLLIVHFLSPVEQGYYYALWSLVSLQVIFELGFSFVIQQLAAHESVHLVFAPNGGVSGSASAHGRLASILQLMIKWYGRAAVGMITLLVPGGWLFFTHRGGAIDHVAWRFPWLLAAVACASTFLLGPFYSFLDGCGKVREVAAMRLREGVAALLMAWGSMITHHGLYAPAMVILGQASVGCHFVWQWRRLLFGLYCHPPNGHAVSWRDEILPFQWRTAVSWFCSYFTVQAFIPLLFSLRGPIEAGKMGMSLSITGYLWATVLPWTSTKATPFGSLVARHEFRELDRLFFRTLRQSIAVLAGIAALCMACMLELQCAFPAVAARMVAPWLFALLLATSLSVLTVQSLAIYLRAHKKEPFLWQSIFVASLTLGGIYFTVPRWGLLGATVTYFGSTGGIGLIFALAIFQRERRRHWVPGQSIVQENAFGIDNNVTVLRGDAK